MKKIDAFINQYSVPKTLQFKLIPYGKTLENFTANKLLEQDKERAKAYSVLKNYMDIYHRYFIDNALFNDIKYLDIKRYAELYYKKNKSDAEKKQLKDEAAGLRKYIANVLRSHSDFKKLFGKEMILELLPGFECEEIDKAVVAQFNRFTTYFIGFYENRKNVYTDDEKSTGIAYRCINDNLPKFLDNANIFKVIVSNLPQNVLEKLDDTFEEITGCTVEEMFSVDNFAYVLTQKGISAYNEVVGGYTSSNGEKIQGLNEYINLYNQTHNKTERLPKMKMLFKQILSDKISVSFIPESFENDDSVIAAVRKFYNDVCVPVSDSVSSLFSEIDTYASGGIYIKNGVAITDLSQNLLGSWRTIRELWNNEYDSIHGSKQKKNPEKYENERKKAWDRHSAFSLNELEKYTDGLSVAQYYRNAVINQILKIKDMYLVAEKLLESSYADKPKRLAKNDEDITLIKNLLDSIKELEWILKPFCCPATEENKDVVFYGVFEDSFNQLQEIDSLYDKVRNYITKKPYSKNKIKLNFENPQLLGGWDKNKERDYRTVLLQRGNLYYLGIMDKNSNRIFEDYPSDEDNGWSKIDYKLLPGPNKMLPKVLFAKSNIDYYAPSDEVLRIYSNETFKKGEKFSLSDCHKLIGFYQDCIKRHSDWAQYGFSFKQPSEYKDISEFYKDVELQGYKITYNPISEEYIEEKVSAGELYLFQIYSKDFSDHSKGTPNMHTLYFKMLFDERNLRNVVYQLNGGAEMFYRLPSIKDEEKIIHPQKQPVKNKNPHTNKKHSVFDYDLIKDKRFTEPQFSLHLPIKLNFKAIGNTRINASVRKALKDCEHNYVIGIDRGERHLLYITVIDENGNIAEQFSGNQIINTYNGVTHTVDYHNLLEEKEKQRLEARQNWSTIENIKELKEGYISQIVHKICELVVKYDAVIAMENLNSGFKNSRVKVEKQVYQKFEKMLIDKLNYLVDKHIPAEENGGLLNAYQLTEKFESFKKMSVQNGFIFYIPAWLTSKIDPTTGFVDLLKPKYTGVDESKKFIEKFKSIRFNSDENIFEFTFDYKDFPRGTNDYKGVWTICTNGTRIETHRSDSANGNFVSEDVELTKEWIDLFDSANVDYKDGCLKEEILEQNEKAFFERFMYLLRLTLQMRNSKTGTDVDYLISPVKNAAGKFYNSDECKVDATLPSNADANGAYNIARKALWAISVIKNTPDEDLPKANISITNEAWLKFAQSNE